MRDLFEDADAFERFLAGEDYSYGLADVPDAVYEERYEELLEAIKGVAQPGTVVSLPTVTHHFLRDAPLVDGDWIDCYVVKLAE